MLVARRGCRGLLSSGPHSAWPGHVHEGLVRGQLRGRGHRGVNLHSTWAGHPLPPPIYPPLWAGTHRGSHNHCTDAHTLRTPGGSPPKL